ncbi:MAG: hypothetical protein ACYCTE_10005 [Acidimicrobiales bacterium]
MQVRTVHEELLGEICRRIGLRVVAHGSHKVDLGTRVGEPDGLARR